MNSMTQITQCTHIKTKFNINFCNYNNNKNNITELEIIIGYTVQQWAKKVKQKKLILNPTVQLL